MLEDERRQLGDLDRGIHRRTLLIWKAEQDEWCAIRMAREMPFHRHDFGGLMLQCVQSVEVANQNL